MGLLVEAIDCSDLVLVPLVVVVSRGGQIELRKYHTAKAAATNVKIETETPTAIPTTFPRPVELEPSPVAAEGSTEGSGEGNREADGVIERRATIGQGDQDHEF